MSEQSTELWDDPETDPNPNAQTGGGQLRDFAERMKAKNQELESENSTLKHKIRTTELSGALGQAGYDPAAIAVVPDSVTDTDGLTAWLENHGSFLTKTATQEQQQEEPPAPETTLSEEDQANLAATTGAPQGAPPSVSQSEMDRLAQATSRDEYWKIMQEIQRGQAPQQAPTS